MVYLKEDGSLDVERIDSLPLEEYEKVMGQLTEEQMDEYFAKQPEDVAKGPIRPIYVDNSMEEDGVDADEVIKSLREQCGITENKEQDEENNEDKNPDIQDMLLVTIRQLDNPEVVL